MIKEEIKVISFVENEDGSANIELDVSDDVKQMILDEGFKSILRKYIDEHEKNT